VRISLPFGKENLSLSLPDTLVGQILKPSSLPAVQDIGGELGKELTNEHCQLFLARVEKQAKSRKDLRVAITVNDYTRPTPLHSVLPHLFDVLNRRGVYDSQISIVVALGTHRPMSTAEFRAQAGEEVLRRVDFINPDFDDPDTLGFFGRSPSGVEVWVNRVYAGADFKIAVGTILPHGAVGFSGGAKVIYPGIAGRKTVESFHVAANANPENRAGRLESPVRGEIEKLVEMVGLDLMINLVVNPDGEVCGLTAAHYIESHRRAVPLARKLYGIPVDRQSSILVAASFPADLDFWQAAKAIFNCQAVVRNGGWLILVTPCAAGIPVEHASFDRCIGMAPAEIEALFEGSASTAEPIDRVTLAPALALARFRERINIAVVSPGLKAQQVERMGFCYFPSVAEALKEILRNVQEQEQRVDIVTHGGSTYPSIAEL
jgi:nickel-dependent lactate racemase